MCQSYLISEDNSYEQEFLKCFIPVLYVHFHVHDWDAKSETLTNIKDCFEAAIEKLQ